MEIRCEEDRIKQLYKASVRGCVPMLNELIKKDPLILNKISLTSMGETLLHISASLGHLDFTKALLNYKPKLASELDSHNRSALHLASAEGHTEIVKALLDFNNIVCLTADEEGRIPLHYAAMRGRIEVIQLIMNDRPRSIRVRADREKTALHLCVLYNHFEALKVLVEYVNDDFEFLNLKDNDGNTILHLAVMLKHVETTKYLLSRPGVEENALNGIGLTALNVIEQCSRDFKSHEIRNLLMRKGEERAKNQNYLPPILSPTSIPIEPAESRWWKKWIQYLIIMITKCMGYLKGKGQWVEKTRETLMLVATVITTTTFQSILNPPGGVWPDKEIKSETCHPYDYCSAGTAVLAYADPDQYYYFLSNNTVSFLSSLCVILLLISGIPLENKFGLWLLIIAMTLALIFLGFTYLGGMHLVTPTHAQFKIYWIYVILLKIAKSFLFAFAVIYTIRCVHWLVKKLRKRYRRNELTGSGNKLDHPLSLQLQVQTSGNA